MRTRQLLIDAGNSRLKWVLIIDGVWQPHGIADYSDLSELALNLAPEVNCVVSSVAHARHEEAVKKLLAQHAVESRWLTADVACMDVRNTYNEPQKLGVDRWMGLIAARKRKKAATLVVSLGTAMTVDSLSDEGVFLGGLILPGWTMMKQSLVQQTSKIMETDGIWQPFPQSTCNAVHSGIIAAMCGAIQLQHARLAERSRSEPHCLVTGGDAERLLPYVTVASEHVPFLVLEGMEQVVMEGRAA